MESLFDFSMPRFAQKRGMGIEKSLPYPAHKFAMHKFAMHKFAAHKFGMCINLPCANRQLSFLTKIIFEL